MRVAGASQFLNASSLANLRGIAPSTPSVLSGSTISLLDVGRSSLLAGGGFGLSSSARALNEQFINNGLVNQMFSLGVGTDATVDGARQQILALRSGLSDNRLAPFLRAEETTQNADTGAIVDEQA